jgi:methylated-DNA-[protein]-cysteine S-methyltransferase
VPAQHVSYEAPGWGVGEIWLDGNRLLHHELPRAAVERQGPEGHALGERFASYFAGEADDFLDVPLELEGATEFERELTAVLRNVGRGETVTYGELAALAGRPNAQRAAGSFCARNRFALVVPCHRVVAASGLGSYGSLGVDYKRRLLELEGVAV